MKNGMIVDIGKFGGTGDGHTDNSRAFTSAIASLKRAGGGTLRVSGGHYLTGPIELFDNMALHVEEDAILQFLPDFSLYPPVLTRWEGIVCFGMQPLIFARDAHHIRLSGKGSIDGSGNPWWSALRHKKSTHQTGPVDPVEIALAAGNKGLIDQPSGGGGREMQFLRPPLVQFFKCSNIEIEDLTFRNSPFWTIHPVFSNHIVIHDILIQNPPDAPNTDGIDIDSCTDIDIGDSTIDVGDDCLAIKAGSGEHGLREGRPSARINIHNCLFRQGHGGVVIGSETAGGIHDVSVSGCSFDGTDRGIRLKTRRGRGGDVSGLRFHNLNMRRVLCPVAVNMYYRCGAKAEESAELFSPDAKAVTSLTPRLGDIEISHLDARGCRASAGFIVGLPEAPVESLKMEHCHIGLAARNRVPVSESEMTEGVPETEFRGIRVRHAHCGFNNVEVTGLKAEEAPFNFEG